MRYQKRFCQYCVCLDRKGSGRFTRPAKWRHKAASARSKLRPYFCRVKVLDSANKVVIAYIGPGDTHSASRKTVELILADRGMKSASTHAQPGRTLRATLFTWS
ncbi:MAG: hypothetical protein ACRD3O_21540, partial [Terriglobia bacterium]